MFYKIKVLILVSLSILSIFGLSKEVSAIDHTTNYISQLDIHLSSSCKHGSAIFRVTNVGENKIKDITFKLFKATDGFVISERMMSLNQGQAATFKVKNANGISDNIGMFIDTKTFSRPKKSDVSIRCS